MMAGRIMEMRQALKDGLEKEGQNLHCCIYISLTRSFYITIIHV